MSDLCEASQDKSEGKPLLETLREQYEDVLVLNTPSDRIGCAPVQLGIQKKVADNGLVSLSNKNTLLAAVVLIAPCGATPRMPNGLRVGDVVYFDARNVKAPWCSTQYDIVINEGEEASKVILVPVEEVLAVRRKVRRFKKG